MLERRSAIASALARGGRQPNGQAGCRLGELRDWTLLQVAGFPETMAGVERALAAIYGLAPAPAIGEVTRNGVAQFWRTGPEQIWIIASGSAPDQDLVIRNGLVAAEGIVTLLSHSRTRMFLEGPRVRDVLAKGIAIDLHPDEFGIDRFAMTGLDHTPVILHRVAADRYEIYAMRTFALTVWDWLTDAALEYGYEIVA
jgi:methylglutamate dehydrogenase subunit D